MASIEKRLTEDGKTSYRVKIRLKGYPPDSATFERLTDARTWATKTEADMKAGRYFGAAKRHTLKELIEKYSAATEKRLKTWRETERHLSMWLGLLGDCQLDAITPQRITECRDKLLAEVTVRGKPRNGSTVTRMMAALSSCMAFGVKELQWLDRNPMEKTSKPGQGKPRVRYLSDTELPALLRACRESSNPDLHTAVVLSLTTGARQAEIMGLRWSQVDFKHGTITLRQGETKNDDARALPLVGDAFELLQARAKVRMLHDDRVFPPTDRAKKATRLDLRTPWEGAIEKAGLGTYEGEGKERRFVPNFRWHDLRHTAASYLVMSGVDLISVARILGHRQLQMTLRYSHLAPGKVVEHGNALAQRLGLGNGNTAA